jgi:HD-like signal output (HDOD) protein
MLRWLRRLLSAQPAAPAQPAPATAAPATAPMPARSPVPTREAIPFDRLEQVNAAWNAWLFERKPSDDEGLDLNDAENQVLQALQAILASQQSGAALVRRMPGLVPQLLQSLRSDTFSGSALSRTISSDVVLVAAVLRLANAAYAGSGAAVASVEQAVILIGQEGLRQLITTVAFRPIIDVHSGWFVRRLAPRLWEHAERCAASARRLAAEYGVEPFDAFLACLLQNVGLTIALRVMDGATGGAPGLGNPLFLAQLARDTRLLGVSIAREWNFPQAVAQALAEQGGLRRDAPMSPLGRLLQLTDRLGKLCMLAEQDLAVDAGSDPLAGLPAPARECYALLAASREQPAAA